MQMPQPWWTTDQYTGEDPIPPEFLANAGPEGVAVVRVWKDGTTDRGWGTDTFMENYVKGRFKEGRVLPLAKRTGANFAFVMRSVRLVCIDIDPKNGGDKHVGKLGMLPYTMAETSKSGNGYHLFYLVADDEWSDDYGFAPFSDRIGIQQGVDVRVTGCVYHHPTQRWNNRQLVELPEHIKDMLRSKQQAATAQVDAIIKILDLGDQEEVLLMHDTLLEDLKKPIPPGRRNTTLFAIGSQLFLAQVPNWESLIEQRARDLGLDQQERDKLIRNIRAYAPKAVAP
jgi:hypothetical protein